MALTDAMMVRFNCLDNRIREGKVLEGADQADYDSIVMSFLVDMARTDPVAFRREYGDPEEFLRRA